MPSSDTYFKPGHSGGRPTDTPEVKAAKEFARAKSLEAMECLHKLMSSNNEKIRIMAANGLLDRGLGRPVPATDSDENHSQGLDGAILTVLESQMAQIARLTTLLEAAQQQLNGNQS